MSDKEFTNEDFLSALQEAQESSRPKGPGNFMEWVREQQITKARGNSSPISPGFGLMGHLNTASRAPYGPTNRSSGNQAVGFKALPSKYDSARLNQPPPWIDDVNMSSQWYSPMEPVWPFGPPYYNAPREWNYPVGYNLNFIPQRLNLVETLRGMRQSWGILSTVITTRQDQLLRLPWTVQVRGKPRANSKGVDLVRKFFKKPDGILSYQQWARKYLDDLFVIDAPTVYLDRGMGGQILEAQVIDGGMIFPLIDDAGRRPHTEKRLSPEGIVYEHRQPAFQQITYGLPMINLSEDEIIYGMMRPRPELPIFGYPPVEQILVEATEAIRKTFYQLEFWRSGSMPELIITVPDNWTPRQIATFQAHFDAVLSGQLTLKSKVRFVPGGMKPFDIKNASGESLWSQRDELLVRLCCYAFSVSPTPFIHQTNRATANQAQESSQEEGLYPLMSYWKDDVMDEIIQNRFGFEDIEFTFLPRAVADQTKQATIHQIQIDEALRTRNEVREELGLEPVEGGDILTVKTGAMVARLDQVISGDLAMPGAAAPPDEPRPAGPEHSVNNPVRGSAQPRVNSSSTPKTPTPVRKLSGAEIARAAEDAKRNPSNLKRKIGNYRKGHISLHGLSISIENAKGSKRGEKDRFGQSWEVKMPCAYGYIRGTVGADNMQVDCYLGKRPESNSVWVIDQDMFDSEGVDKGFDEHKVMLAFKSPEKAIKMYLKSHFDDLGHERLSAVSELSYDELKSWLKKGDMKRPISEQGIGHVVARRGKGGGITKADTISSSTGLNWYDQTSATRRGRKKRKKAKSDLKGPRWLMLRAS